MPDALPKIRITDSHHLSGGGGISPVFPSPALTEPDRAARPRSAVDSDEYGQQTITGLKGHIKMIRNASNQDRNGGNFPPASAPVSANKTENPASGTPVIDPLSHHILKRTNTENTIPQRLQQRNNGRPESPIQEVTTPGSTEIREGIRHSGTDPIKSESVKEKKKGVSFLSRFSIGGKKKDHPDEVEDEGSEHEDQRTEGMNAHVFSSSIGANGYIPLHKEPPSYIKVRAHYKKEKEFDRIFLAQELRGTKRPNQPQSNPDPDAPPPTSSGPRAESAVWAAEFSRDGKYLAAAGRDRVVRVWAVISNAEQRAAHESQEDAGSREGHGERLSAPVFIGKPVREFEGHTMDVLDLSWSKNNFLLSSSMDKTVRLWHVTREECLCTFKHKDFVTSIAFHPRDDRFFLAGSLDSVLRLWSIPDKSVAFWCQLPDLITAVAFTPDGKQAIAGVNNGFCLFYETEGLKYITQIHVRSSRGKNAKGSKITGIRTMPWPPEAHDGEVRLLITSNDSRVRIYNLQDKSLEMKFKSHQNQCSQIRASFNDDGKYVICGSEDRRAYIWSTTVDSDTKDKRPVEHFAAHSDLVTAAIFAPTKTRQLLGASGDPLYDLCNPPPVQLLSRAESHVSGQIPGHEKRISDPVSEPKRPEESPAYLARCMHMDGNIIVTADHSGNIKVFRQDCAFQKRRNDMWETGSNFSKTIGTVGRNGSIRSHNRSRRNSVSQTSLHSHHHLPSDHILSWRSSIVSNASIDSSIRGVQPPLSDRSVSPGRFTQSRSSVPSNQPRSSAKEARQQHYGPVSTAPNTATNSVAATSPPPSIYKSTSHHLSQPPTPSFSLHGTGDDNPLKIDDRGYSYTFWDKNKWKRQQSDQDPERLGPDGGPLSRGMSTVSALSSEDGSAIESEGEVMVCRRCGGSDFRAKKVTGKQRLACVKCGLTVD